MAVFTVDVISYNHCDNSVHESKKFVLTDFKPVQRLENMGDVRRYRESNAHDTLARNSRWHPAPETRAGIQRE